MASSGSSDRRKQLPLMRSISGLDTVPVEIALPVNYFSFLDTLAERDKVAQGAPEQMNCPPPFFIACRVGQVKGQTIERNRTAQRKRAYLLQITEDCQDGSVHQNRAMPSLPAN